VLGQRHVFLRRNVEQRLCTGLAHRRAKALVHSGFPVISIDLDQVEVLPREQTRVI
jgi:hypothetical protein